MVHEIHIELPAHVTAIQFKAGINNWIILTRDIGISEEHTNRSIT